MISTILRSFAWTITRRVTNDMYDKATQKKPSPAEQRRQKREQRRRARNARLRKT